jgi:predicted Zn-dependent peptidase
MVVTVVGDIDHIQIFEQIEKNIESTNKSYEIERIYPEESDGLNKKYIEQNMPVPTPLFYTGFKDNNYKLEGAEILKYELAVKLLLSMIIGRSSELYTKLYDEGLINSNFETDFSIEKSYAYSMIGGESKNPEAVKERIVKEIRKSRDSGLDSNTYERLLKASKGRFLRQMNSVESISRMFINLYFKGVSMFDYLDVYDTIGFDYISDVFDSHFDIERMALSVIKQK